MNDNVTVTPRSHAVALYNHALTLLQTDRVMAYRCAASAVEADPTVADAWMLLGRILADDKSFPASIAAYRAGLLCPVGDGRGDLNRALKHKLLVNLGHRLMQNGELTEAEDVTDEAIRMWGRGPDGLAIEGAAFAMTNRSLIYSHRGLNGAAVVDARRGLELFDDPMTRMGHAFALLFNGQYAEGLAAFEARFEYKLKQYLTLPYPRWDGGRVETLIVMCEQGLGDSVSFARFIPHVATCVGRVIFAVQPELVGLFTGALPENVEVIPSDYVLPPADAWCPVFSLPVSAGLTTEEIIGSQKILYPQSRPLDASPPIVFPEGQFNVVIAYAGAPGNDIDQHRSIPPAEFLALRKVPGVALWSVQVGPRVKELHDAGCASMIRDLSPYIRDARDTAALIRQADLVICCESFVGHLAGVLDAECWVLASKLGRDWRIGTEGESALWFTKHRVFRQGEDRAWRPVFDRVVKALKERVV